MKFNLVVVIVMSWTFLSFVKSTNLDPDMYRNVTELISTKGYPVKEYEVQTADGFILSLQRIPHGRGQQNSGNCKREVVFLMHGIASDSSTFVLNFEQQSLAFILADRGYDVWLGNNRGNTYSNRHIKLTPNMKEYWDFSIEEYAEYDAPAMIDFILNQTKEEQLVYISYSQGATWMLALLSEHPEYNQKIKLFIALAPVTSIEHMTSVIRYFIPIADEIAFTLNLLGIYNLAPPTIIKDYLKTGACNREVKFICEAVIFSLFGYDPQQLNETRLSVYTTHFLTGSSVKNLLHFAQMRKAKKFQKFDYGPSGNLRHYNQATPPVYNVTPVIAPFVSMWGMNDKVADPRDVQQLEKFLPNVVLSYPVRYKAFSHADFVLAIDAYQLLHQKILTVLCNLSND